MSFEPSMVRRSLDRLLAVYPSFDLVSLDWGHGYGEVSVYPVTPWVLVKLGQPSESFDEVPAWALWQFAIFKRTGALHTMKDGAVSDDPIWTPQ